MAITFASAGDVIGITPIPEQIKKLRAISCDVCNTEMASYDVFVRGMIKEVNALKRCCDECLRYFSPQ